MPANGSAPPRLTVVEGPGRGLTVPVAGGGLVMGRTSDADIMLPDPDVSRRHALVRCASGRTVITDLGSTNGTRVNGRWIERQPWELRPGDEVTVGSTVLRYDAGDAGTAVMPAVTPGRWDAPGRPDMPGRSDTPGRPDMPGRWDTPGRPVQPVPVNSARQSAHAESGGTVVQGLRDAIHAKWHIGTLGTGGLVAGVALVLVIAVAVVVVMVNRVHLEDLAGRWRHPGGEVGGMTMEPTTLTVGSDGAFRLVSGIKMGFGEELGTTMRADCRGDAEPAFGRFTFHPTSGACGAFSGELVSDGRGLELSGNDDRAPMTLTRTD